LEWGCPSEFGNPSGHSWLVTVIYEPVITDLTGLGYYSLGSLFPVVVAVLVPLSRMYLGAHSGNEVLMGLTLGFGMCVLYRLLLQRKLYRVFELLLDKYWRRATMIWAGLFNILCIAAPLIIFGLSSTNRPVPDEYIAMLSNKCNHTYTSLGLQGTQLVSGGIINVVFGAMIGIGVSEPTNYLYLYGYWGFVGTNWKQKTWRIILKLLI
jgi:hypothetical protein